MSVVCWDGKTLAADRQATDQGIRVPTAKILRLPTGEVVAWVGGCENGMSVCQWYSEGANPKHWPKCQEGDNFARFIVMRNGKLWEYEQLPIAQPVMSHPAAWGSGRDLSLGAMAMGADAVKAVEVAAQYSTSVGMGVDSYHIDQSKTKSPAKWDVKFESPKKGKKK